MRLTIFFLLLSFSSFATQCTIANGGGTYSVTSTWTGSVVPTSADTVVATATSGQLTVNSTTAACKALLLSGYTSTLTINSGARLTVSGSITFTNSMSCSGTGELRINATGTITSGGITWTGNLNTFGNITVTLADDWTINGSYSTASSGTTTTMNNNSLYIKTSITPLSNGKVQGTTNLIAIGTGTISSGSIGSPLSMNTTGTITFGTYKMSGGSLTWVAGTSITTGGTITIDGGSTYTLNTNGSTSATPSTTSTVGINFNNISMTNGSPTITLTSNMCIAGTMTIGSTLSPIFNGTNGFYCQNLTGLSAGKTLTLKSAVTYVIYSSITVNGTSGSHATIKSEDATVKTILTLDAACSQALSYCNGTRVDSSGGKLVNAPGGILTETINWGVLTGGSPIFID